MPAKINFLPPALAICTASRAPLSGCMRPKKKQTIFRIGLKIELGKIDAVMNGLDIIEFRRPVGVADGGIEGFAVVFFIHRQNSGRRRAVNGGHDRGGRQAAIGQGQIIEMVVDNVVGIGTLKEFRDVLTLPDLGDEGAVLFIPLGVNGTQFGTGLRVRGCKQGDIMTACNYPLGEKRGHIFPGPIIPWRCAPGDRRKHGDMHGSALTPRLSGRPAGSQSPRHRAFAV